VKGVKLRKYMNKIGVAVLLAVVLFAAAGCGQNAARKASQKQATRNYYKEQAAQQKALAEQLQQTPVEYPDYSDERANINERNIRLNDPNKITYIYGISFGGSVIFHDTAKGKVSACNAQILPEEGPVRYRGEDLVVPQPEPDGTFTPGHECIFYFTVQGAYREYEGNYFMSDQPVTLRQPVVFEANVNADITNSTHAKTGNDKHK
jgi:hypothetical protein